MAKKKPISKPKATPTSKPTPKPTKKTDAPLKKKTGTIIAGVKKNKGSKVIADLKLGARKNVQS